MSCPHDGLRVPVLPCRPAVRRDYGEANDRIGHWVRPRIDRSLEAAVQPIAGRVFQSPADDKLVRARSPRRVWNECPGAFADR